MTNVHVKGSMCVVGGVLGVLLPQILAVKRGVCGAWDVDFYVYHNQYNASTGRLFVFCYF